MEANTGIIIEIEGGNRSIKRDAFNEPAYLEESIKGGGVLTELSGNKYTLKATMLDAMENTQKIAIPTANFMDAGDVVTVVLDDDGCELMFVNHALDRTWQFSRCPAQTRRWTRAARIAISQGLLWTCLIGIAVGLAQGRSMNLNIAAVIPFIAFVWAAIWTLTTRRKSAAAHTKAAQKLAKDEKLQHADFIVKANEAKTAALKSAAMA